jgi:hypothetical protein
MLVINAVMPLSSKADLSLPRQASLWRAVTSGEYISETGPRKMDEPGSGKSSKSETLRMQAGSAL